MPTTASRDIDISIPPITLKRTGGGMLAAVIRAGRVIGADAGGIVGGASTS